MSLQGSIQNLFSAAIVQRCRERGCGLELCNLESFTVLKGERIRRDIKICDCIVFVEDSHVGSVIGIVELKGKTAHADEIREKLANGTTEACNVLTRCSSSRVSFEFCHIVLCKRWRASEYKVMTSRTLTVSGSAFDIHAKRCGISFAELVRSTR